MLTGQKEKPGRAAVCCRVSSDEQDEVVKLGTQLDQIATRSIKSGKEMSTGGTGEGKGMSKKAINKAPKKIFARPPIDGTDEELEAWCETFIAALRGEPVEIADEDEKPEPEK